jgi:Fe-Mn family superoxide dismutase
MKKFLLLALFSAEALFGAVQTYAPQNYSHLLGMPGFSDSLLQMHFKLYQGYVKNTNDLLLKLNTMGAGQASSYEYGALKRRLGWEFDGMRLHELYFDNLGGNGNLDPASPLFAAIATQFGSFEKWKRDFIATGSMRGIGWAILYLDPVQGRLMNVWINEHDVGHLAGGTPILIMDVFEHAYMPQYGLDRAKYIDAFFQNINWKAAGSRFPR